MVYLFGFTVWVIKYQVNPAPRASRKRYHILLFRRISLARGLVDAYVSVRFDSHFLLTQHYRYC
jgi:hypothetical protein